MKPKIIVADDSLTIQKVIKITLANEEFDLVECVDELNLVQLILENEPIVALLDFNLSENKTGYDLAREIRELGVAKVFMLYGTFDTIDEKLLEHSGVSAHIVKPFEGNKFINICRQLVEDVNLEIDKPKSIPAADEFDDSFPEPMVDEEDMWVVNQPSVEEPEDLEEDELVRDEIVSADEKNSLEAGMQDWGIDVPGIIGEATGKQYALVDLPPVIEEEYVEESADNFVENDAPTKEDDSLQLETITEVMEEEALPDSEDLEYPDVDMIKSVVEAEVLEPKSKLISIAELAQDNAPEESFDNAEGTKTQEEILDLEAQIADEVDDNFWTADEVIGEKIEESKDENKSISILDEVIAKVEKIKAAQELEDSNKEEEEYQEPESTFVESSEVLSGLNEEKILAMIEPIVQKLVEKRVQEILEKVAWEVIPDLSENLIKKEIEKISQSILNSKK